MNIQNTLFPGGKTRCLTLSYDDGVGQDRRLVDMLNRYGLRCTFNINSGLMDPPASWTTASGVRIERMDISEVAELYRGHEVAVHTVTHPHLELMPRDRVLQEVLWDRMKLEAVVGYPVTGMAYPFGTYSPVVVETLKAAGIRYSRTVASHGKFHWPEELLTWHPTCHHKHPEVRNLLKAFLEQPVTGRNSLFYLWGHAYEFDVDNNWELMEDICRMTQTQPDLWMATNMEFVRYTDAVKRLEMTLAGNAVYNPSVVDVWLRAGDGVVVAKAGAVTAL